MSENHNSVRQASFVDPPLSELRQVTVYFTDGRDAHSYLVHQSEVDKFVAACKRLHVAPGVNPHNGMQCAKACKITVAPLCAHGPYWWSTPNLRENFDPAGARVIDVDASRVHMAFIDEAQVANMPQADG